MREIEIFFSEDSERSEYEATSKGYRSDVYAKVRNKIYKLNIFTLLRLGQEFEYAMEKEGNYYLDPNIVLVRETNKNEIINTINNLFEQNYFEKIKETEYKEISDVIGIRDTKLNLVKVYWYILQIVKN